MLVSNFPQLYSHKYISPKLIREADFFDENILLFRQNAENLWMSVSSDIAKLEKANGIPFRLNESTHLYAIDAFVIADVLGLPMNQAAKIARIYIIIFLLCSYFDDHVEHRDKLFNKFLFSNSSDRSAQEGAMPFAIIFMLQKLLRGYVEETGASASDKSEFLFLVNDMLLSYTPNFALERRSERTPEIVLRIKQHNVSGKIVAMLADIGGLVCDDTAKLEILRKGLFYVGSVMQMTDDLRDAEIDNMLNNANLLNAYTYQRGDEIGLQEFSEFFVQEYRRASQCLEPLSPGQTKLLLSIPFYPFCL